MFERFIAKRYVKSKRRLSFITIIARVSMLGVSVGVASLIVVLSVFNGFSSLAKKLMLSAEPHLQIKIVEKISDDEKSKIDDFLRKNSEVNFYYKYVEGKAIVGTEKHFEILTLKGIEESKFNSEKLPIKKYLSHGTNEIKEKRIFIALTNAIKLNARIGDKIKVTSFQSLEKSAVTLSLPKIADLRVAGIFSSPNNNLNANLVFANYNDVKFLFNKKNRLTGYDVFLNNYKNADKVKAAILKLNLGGVQTVTWQENHKQLFNMMKLERFAAFLLLTLIIAVASFNILNSLTMSVTVKQKDIAVLRSIGVTKKSIRKIFIIEGLIIGIKGTLFGFALGMSIFFAQLHFKIYKLDATKYVIDALPVKLDFVDILATLLISVLLAAVSAIYPAKQAVKTNIIEAIKWE